MKNKTYGRVCGMKRVLMVALLGTCSAYGATTFYVDSVEALTNAIDRATADPGDAGAPYDIIRLKAGVTFDLSTLSEYTSPDGNWGTMGAPAGNSNGKSCIWFKKKLHFEGEDTTHWKSKTSAQESVLDGGNVARIVYTFTVTSGDRSTFKHIVFANGQAESGKNGGGLFSSGPSLHNPKNANASKMGFATNCVFRSCSASNGGGSYCYNVYDSGFEGCSATDNGGGAYGSGSATYTWTVTNRFDTCVFSGCTAGCGGGLYHNESSALEGDRAGYVANCIFTNCTATSNGGGGAYFNVGGLVRDCLFVTNTCTKAGGVGGACWGANAERCTFIGNISVAGRGGAMYLGTAVDCAFTNNTHVANSVGGACAGTACTRCTFSGFGDVSGGSLDRCVFDGITDGYIFANANDGLERNLYATNCLVINCRVARAIHCRVASYGIELVNCTFADNTIGVSYPDYGSLAESYDTTAYMVYGNQGTATLKNCLFSGNMRKHQSKEVYYDSDLRLYTNAANNASIQLSNCLFTKAESASNYNWAEGAETLVQGNPLFVAGNAAYPDLPYYSILRKSPARNAGVNAAWMNSAVDLAGNARIFEDVVDIGCYECQISPLSGMVLFVR